MLQSSLQRGDTTLGLGLSFCKVAEKLPEMYVWKQDIWTGLLSGCGGNIRWQSWEKHDSKPSMAATPTPTPDMRGVASEGSKMGIEDLSHFETKCAFMLAPGEMPTRV